MSTDTPVTLAESVDGTLVTWVVNSSYGFIQFDENIDGVSGDVFLHLNDVTDGRKVDIREGISLTADVVDAERGPQAADAKLRVPKAGEPDTSGTVTCAECGDEIQWHNEETPERPTCLFCGASGE